MQKMRKGIYVVFGVMLAVLLINQLMQTDAPAGESGDTAFTTRATLFSTHTESAVTAHATDRSTAQITTASNVDRFPNLPQTYRNNLYVDSRMYGGCMSLTGDVHITVVFADDGTAAWTAAAQTREKEKYQAAAELVKKAARSYGETVNIRFSYLTAKVSGTPSLSGNDEWVERAIKAAGLPARAQMNDTLERQYGVKEAPVIFAVNHTGRAFATPNGGGEHIVLHATDEAFCHELYHLFGAEDFYFPDDVAQIARDVFGKSVMLDSGEQTVDSLTAYLIGWTDTPGRKALHFLEKTNHITREKLSEEYKKEIYTGYVKNRDMGTYIFTGNLKDGSPTDGKCVYVYDSGARYDGTIQGGQFHGKGKYIWNNGDSYDGDWVHGERTGKGTYVWKSGGKYVGEWKDSERQGQGTYITSAGGK